MSIGKLIKAARNNKNLTLRELGRISGVSYSQISKIERLQDIPSEQTIIKLAEALGLDIELDVSDINDGEQKENLVRYKTLLRDEFKCQLCGNSAPEAKLVVSDIIPRKQVEESNLKSLITLCSQCNSGRIKVIEEDGIENDILYRNFKSDRM